MLCITCNFDYNYFIVVLLTLLTHKQILAYLFSTSVLFGYASMEMKAFVIAYTFNEVVWVPEGYLWSLGFVFLKQHDRKCLFSFLVTLTKWKPFCSVYAFCDFQKWSLHRSQMDYCSVTINRGWGGGGDKGWDREGWQEPGAKENIFVQRAWSHLARSSNYGVKDVGNPPSKSSTI